MPRAMWTGSVSFGMVNVPIRMFSAVGDESVSFNLLHEEDHHRVRQQRVCPAHDPPQELDWEDIVKGYKVDGDRYVVVEPEELKALEPDKQNTIEIEAFVDLEAIDPVFFDRSYYLAPEETGTKAYKLLHEVMKRAGRVGVGRFVMRSNEYLAALRPTEEGIVLETLNFHDEVRDQSAVFEEVTLPEEVEEREVDLALQLVDGLTEPWNPEDYEDTYRRQVLDLVERKRQGEEVAVPEPEIEEPPEGDLVRALEASIESQQGPGEAEA
jgi:DNA end-binding protein Ku